MTDDLVDEGNVEYAYHRISFLISLLIAHGISEAEVFSAIGDVLVDLSDPDSLETLH